MQTTGEITRSKLTNLQLAAHAAVRRRSRFETDHGMGDAVKLQVGTLRGPVIEHDDGAATTQKQLLKRQNLTAVAQRALCKQAHFRQRIQYQTRRIESIYRGNQFPGGFGQLHFGGVQHGELTVTLKLARI